MMFNLGWWFSHHVLTNNISFAKASKAMPTASIQTDAWVQHSQCPKAIQHAGQVVLALWDHLPANDMYYVWFVWGSSFWEIEWSQICGSTLHSQTMWKCVVFCFSTVLAPVLCVSVCQWLNSWSLPSRLRKIAMQPCDPSSAFFGFMGVTSALVFANLGAAPRQRTISLEHQPYYDMTLSSWTIKEV